MMKTKCMTIAALGLLLFSAQATAVLEIKITQGVEQALPIAVVPFGWSQGATLPPLDMAAVIAQDLARSGRFAPMAEQDMPQRPNDLPAVNYADWRKLGMESLVIGNVRVLDSGEYDVSFRLLDVFRGAQITGYSVRTTQKQLRWTAHQIADIIYEKLTGVRGAFATRIAYITVDRRGDKQKIHRLEIADADGHNPQILLESPEPLLSPAWSPDGTKLAYVSFEGKGSAVYIQDVFTGSRRKVASNPGINSAPAWSPDGTKLALTLSKDGNPEVYVLHLASNLLQRVTNDPAIDTEAVWSSDGRKLLFTSDRGGGPQIYEVDPAGGAPRRVTFEGPYNARPAISPDGRYLAMINGQGGAYRIAVLDRHNGQLNVLTDSRLDESPSFAPNGHMIIYATVGPRGSELAAVSVDGQVRQRLGVAQGEVREPDWGPFLQ